MRSSRRNAWNQIDGVVAAVKGRRAIVGGPESRHVWERRHVREPSGITKFPMLGRRVGWRSLAYPRSDSPHRLY